MRTFQEIKDSVQLKLLGLFPMWRQLANERAFAHSAKRRIEFLEGECRRYRKKLDIALRQYAADISTPESQRCRQGGQADEPNYVAPKQVDPWLVMADGEFMRSKEIQ